MTPLVRRLLTIGGGAGLVCASVMMIVFGLSGNRLFFYDPSMVISTQVDLSRPFRLGGLVEPGSLSSSEDGLVHRFRVTDCDASVVVTYRGLLPDLFVEGQGAVARGSYDSGGQLFIADEVLARHDEAYTPVEVEEALSDISPKGEYAELLANGCPALQDQQ